MSTYRIQPSAFVDNIAEDGAEMTKLPYPFYVDEDGEIGRQDFWRGTVTRVVGFQRDLAEQQVDLFWKAALADLQQAVGMYLITVDKDGNYATHWTAVESIETVSEEA